MADGCAELYRSVNKINTIPVDPGAGNSGRKRDAINLSILILLALAIGIYLIATTVVISKDGVFYIERAQDFKADPAKAIKTHHPGYPLLIFATHQVVTRFAGKLSLFGWIYCAQGVTLLFRLLALILLYFVGKRLVGDKKSFFALLVLIILPHPAKMSCEVLREWPYLFFLAAGFLCLLWGAGKGKWWMFGLAGLNAGLGYWIRLECVQLIIYGLLWLTLCMICPKLGRMTRSGSLAALVLLLVGFTALWVPYKKYTGRILTRNVRNVFKAISFHPAPRDIEDKLKSDDAVNINQAKIVPGDLARALGEIFKTFGENLMWFFLPPLLIGLYYQLQHGAGREVRFLVSCFVLTNLLLMACSYCFVLPHVSNRWSLPLVAFTIFFVFGGLQIIACRLGNLRSPNKPNGPTPRLSLILLLIGIAICLPKLVRPAGADKPGFRAAAKWLKENTAKDDIVAVPDKRISFYAERDGVTYKEGVPEGTKYVVRIVKDEDEVFDIAGTVRKDLSLWVNEKKKKKKIEIYRIL